MAGLVGAIRRDVRADITIIRAPTRLAADQAEPLDQTLRACLTECPHAVLVDLSRSTVVSPEALAVVTAAAAAVSTDRPSVLVAVCGAPVMVHSNACPSYPDCLTAAADLAATRAGSRRLLHPFKPTNTAAADARAHVRHACWEWNLPHLADTAELVVSELVSNAVSHARTEGTLEVRVRGDFVHIRVEDGSDSAPSGPCGRPGSPRTWTAHCQAAELRGRLPGRPDHYA